MYVYAIYKKHSGYKKARPNWKHQLMFACPVHVTKKSDIRQWPRPLS